MFAGRTRARFQGDSESLIPRPILLSCITIQSTICLPSLFFLIWERREKPREKICRSIYIKPAMLLFSYGTFDEANTNIEDGTEF